MNIILKAFDDQYAKQVLEYSFEGKEFDTCVFVANHTNQKPDIPIKDFIWINAEKQRMGIYDDIDWPHITPLDEELIENMYHSEAVFLTMIGRYARYGDIPYLERKRQYYNHLRYWNHILETKKIDWVLMNTLPHQCYDLVLYHLCKHKDIPISYIERCYIVDAFFLVETVEDSAVEVRDSLFELRQEYSDPNEEIPLSTKYEDVFRANSQESSNDWYTFNRSDRMAQKSFAKKWGMVAIELLFRKPYYFLRSIISIEFWLRKWQQHKTSLLYDQLSKTPDLKRPYIYVPLQYQPEASTCPMSGAYTDQQYMVQLLASHLSSDIAIYVKEHHAQEELCRSEEFYRTLHAIPSVTLVPRNSNTFALMDSALAVATGTGTAGFEAIFREKPVLMFGHRFYQYAIGVHLIHSTEDCKNALEKIVQKREKPTLRDARLFLKALENTGTPYVGGPNSPHAPLTKNEGAKLMGEVIAEKLKPLFAA